MGKKQEQSQQNTPNDESGIDASANETKTQQIEKPRKKSTNSKVNSKVNQKQGSIPGQKKERKKRESVKKEKKQTRDLSGAKLGRPSLEETILDVPEDPSSDVQERFLSYLDKIGLRHGLVFRPEDRELLNKEPGAITKWNANHEWQKFQQKQKIMSNPTTMASIQNYLNYSENKITVGDMIAIFLNISCLFADECTHEVYKILSQVLDSIVSQEDIPAQYPRSRSLFQTLKFFTGSFTKITIKYWIEIPFRNQELIRTEFTSLFCDLVRMAREFLRKVPEIRAFLDDENKMEEELEKIMNQANNGTK